MKDLPDPFQAARSESGQLRCPFHGENIAMILRHADVRAAARNWQAFSSDAPFRVPIPSEEKLRTIRQLPIETNPPEHTEYRAIIEPFFNRAKDPGVIAQVETLIAGLVTAALERGSLEVVREFALPLQSRALTYLLNVPETEAAIWIGWGIHVFHGGKDGEVQGAPLEAYLHAALDRAAAQPGDDFFSALTQAQFRGRALTRDEMMGFANLTFAGGRDTIIHTISSIFAHFAREPEALAFLREDPRRIVLAAEEFFRVVTPLTAIGRVCPVDTEVNGARVAAGERVGLTWASANMDESVFPSPTEVRLDRKPNPHVAFGFGPHLCLGAPHARLLIKTLLQQLSTRIDRLTILEAKEQVEKAARYERPVGYESLRVALTPRTG
jgi:cytochrome P450